MHRRRLALLTLIAALAVALLAGGSMPAAAATARMAGADLVPTQGALFGAYVQGRDGQDGEPAEANLESLLHRKLDLQRIYRSWDDPEPAPAVVTAVRRGRLPILSIRPRYKDGRILSWASIARGDADAAIAQQADGLASLAPGRLFLSFHHEPDDVGASGAHGTPADFVAAWRHYRQVYADRGVTNIAWVWIMMPSSFRSGGNADAYYPGDDAVDWVAEDAYNWFGCSPGKPTAWRAPAELIAPFAAWAEPHGKPLMLAEWGSMEDPAQPQRKAQWLRDGLLATRSWPQLRAMSYFDGVGNCYWRLDGSAAALQGFADDGNEPMAHGRASAFLLPSTTLGVAPLSVRLDGSGSTGGGAANGAGIAGWSLDFGDGSEPISGTGQPPGTVAHTYAAGTYAVRLRVTDTAGGVDQDERSITAATAPVVTGKITDVTATSAWLRAWVAPQGYAATIRAEWGITTAYGLRSVVTQAAATLGSLTPTFPVTGLTPGTKYYARVTATSAAGTGVREWTFDTPGAPTVDRMVAIDVGRSSARLTGMLHPHLLATQYYYEWGVSTDYGRRTDQASLAPVSWAVYVPAAVSGLDRLRTYHFRLVATNALGTVRGPDQVFTTT